MKASAVLAIVLSILFFTACREEKKKDATDLVIGNGKMPNMAKDNAGNLHVVYGSGDSIMYAVSGNGAKSFSVPALIAILPRLTASSMRGPQIACVKEGVIVMACNKPGDIFSYKKNLSGKWSPAVKVNDVDTVAKEGFVALGADGDHAFAAWLDLRGNKRNKIMGAQSTDGGNTWLKNTLVYMSPDTTVCECCKPSVSMQGKNVYVMFRNWLHGNRDMYVIHAADGGGNFGEAKKLGMHSWALNGCPMDGGGLVSDNKDEIETVWRRNDSIYACAPGQPETAIDKGKSATLESVNGKMVYAWIENGEVVIRKPAGMKINLGKGQLPLLKSINNEHVLCVWENDKQVHAAVVSL